MRVKFRYGRSCHLFFLVFLFIQCLPDRIEKESHWLYAVLFAIGVELLALIVSGLTQKEDRLRLFTDILSFLYLFLIAWTLLTAKYNVLREALFPPPGRVAQQFVHDIDKIAVNIVSSLSIILAGYTSALVAAIPLGLFLGWRARLGNLATYLSKFFGSIPPVVYIPYGIALLPTFRSVSVFVIFLASFWPVLASTMSGVMGVDRRIIDSAKVLNVRPPGMLFQVILPAVLPQIFIGCNQGLGVSFILLTSAEMIGARNGMGYYVKNYSDLGDYTRTIVGVIVIGAVITAFVFLMSRLQRALLRWEG